LADNSPKGHTANRDFVGYLKQLMALGDKALPAVKDVLLNTSEDINLRMKLLPLLGNMKNEQAIDLLSDLISSKSTDRQIRTTALKIITHSAPQKTYDMAKNILETEPDFPGRFNLVRAVVKSKDERSAPLLINIAETDPDNSSKYVAVHGLENFIDDASVREKLKILATTSLDPILRQNSIISLSKHKDDQTKMVLEEMLKTEKDDRVFKTVQTILKKW